VERLKGEKWLNSSWITARSASPGLGRWAEKQAPAGNKVTGFGLQVTGSRFQEFFNR